MRLALVAAAGLLLSGQAAFAQQDNCADGHFVVVRANKIKPGQSALFAKAVADQQAWYRAHGVTTNSQLFGPAIKDGRPSADEMLSIHMDAPMRPLGSDAAWDAFVKAFRDSSDIISETRACVRGPK